MSEMQNCPNKLNKPNVFATMGWGGLGEAKAKPIVAKTLGLLSLLGQFCNSDTKL